MAEIKISDICAFVGGKTNDAIIVDTRTLFPAPIDNAANDSITFCSKKTLSEAKIMIEKTRAKVIICSDEFAFDHVTLGNKILIRVPNPRMAFIRIMQRYFEDKVQYGISPTATIDPEAKIHPETYIGPNTFIGKCEIGRGTIIHGNVSIYSKVVIGERVSINSGTVVGADGFGYERDENGVLVRFPNVGGVVIEHDVDIGSNTSIDRGTLGDTHIGEGTKIDNLCHIAHNVVIGRHCSIIAESMIGGSVIIGDYAWVAPSACIRDGIKIGRNSTVGLGAVVTKDVPDNAVVMGVPAKSIRENPIPGYLNKTEDSK
ncbi:MAG: LpxD N-terminal domain-containing protein [Thermoplasmata archaeon]